MKRRVLSLVITLALCLNLCPVWVLAAGEETDGGLCPHHPAHTEACGYVPPVLEQECTHSHDDGCYVTETACVHEHTAQCYPDAEDESSAGEPVLCTHICTEESGCVTRTLSCPHTHDGSCGYVPGNPGAPCTFVCRVCPIEELIGRLPGSVSEDNSEQVQAQIGEIYALYEELTSGEQQQVDLSPCISLLDGLDGMDSAMQSTAGDSSAAEGKYVLEKDTDYNTPYKVSKPLMMDTQNFTLCGTQSTAVQVTETGVLDFRGKILARKGAGIEVMSGGSLRITEAAADIQGSSYGLDIASGGKVQLSTGTYFGKTAAIRTADGDYAALLVPGSAYFDANNKAMLPEDVAQANTVKVAPCAGHSSKSYTPNAGAAAHTWTCASCGIEETEGCTFAFDPSGTGTCTLCGNEITVAVDRESLKELAYDNTVKPANGTVTVKAGDTALAEDTDYTVAYSTRAEVGNTDIKVTVTVTGQTYTGTFTQDYTFTKEELEKPVLEWDTSVKPVPVTVDYDGSPVESAELPPVKINITSTEDLHGLLQYSYRAGSGAYTDGLPADAGTYDVVVSLPEGENHQAASSESITLVIDPIRPIVTPPAAATPTYNRTAQALVTAGALNPVAEADGLEIHFAASENGPYSAAIPTGANAGNYTVWYKVVGLTGNYIAPALNPAEVTGVEILRKAIKPVVELSQTKYQYDGDWKEPGVTVKDNEDKTVLPNDEYQVTYKDNRDVGQATVEVSDAAGGNYAITPVVEVHFQITSRAQETLTITNRPSTFTYGDQFTLETSGGSGSGLVTWEITSGQAQIGQSSGHVTITGHGDITVRATKSGEDPATGVVNYEDAVAVWTFTADKKPVIAKVTAEDKTYNGSADATIHAVVEEGVLPGDEITITGLTGAFDDANAGENKTVTVVTTGAAITGKNSEHYAVSYSSTTVQAAIHKAVAEIKSVTKAGNLVYDGTEQALITGAVVDPNTVQVEYALSEDGPYSTGFPKGTNAGTYTVWYRIQETNNYTGELPASVDVTIDKNPVTPAISLDQDTFTYDGSPKEPAVTLYEADGTTLIPTGEYTVAYSNNVNAGTAAVTVTAKDGGNYAFNPVTKDFTISQEQAQVITAPKAKGLPLFYNTFPQELVTEGTGSGGTMVYSTDNTTFESKIPTEINAGTYTVYYKVAGDSNHSDSEVGQVEVTIAPKRVDNPTIELFDGANPLVSYIYDGNKKEPKVVVKDGNTVIVANEYEIRYDNNINAGNTAVVNIIGKSGGNYDVTGSKTFVIEKADIVFNPAPRAASITYDGKPHELLLPGTATGGTVLYALNSPTTAFNAAIPQATGAGDYTVYYKVVGDGNHNDLDDLANQKVDVTIQRKKLTNITIELTPDSFEYDGKAHLPAVAVKFKEGKTETVVPETEYDWECSDSAPTDKGTYTITITDAPGGNYDLNNAAPKTATFTIEKIDQAELVIEGKPEHVYYGDTFKLTTSGGSGNGAVTWTAAGPATVDGSGNVVITGVGEVTITVEKGVDTNYHPAQAQWTFTAAPKPVTASVTVSNKPYDGNTTATVTTADINADLLTGDTVTIGPASITAVFDTPAAGAGKTVTLDTSKVQVTGDTAKYAISYPVTVTAEITKATTQITPEPQKIDSLEYNGQPQELVTAGITNVGFLVYSLDGTDFSREIPAGTNAGTYTVHYKVDGTTDYTGAAGGTVSVTIAPKTITPTLEPPEFSFLYDGTKKDPKITVKDGSTVIDPMQYTVTWANDDSAVTGGLLTAAGTYTATITNVANGNYLFNTTAKAEIKAAAQTALHITGKPAHVYYGDVITTLDTTGGSGEGTPKWSITAGEDIAVINPDTGVLTVNGVGDVTVKAERTVPNYVTATDTWSFTAKPKPVTAIVKAEDRVYVSGDMSATINITWKDGDLVDSDAILFNPAPTGAFADDAAGMNKQVTVTANVVNDATAQKYAITIPSTVTASIFKADTTAPTLTANDRVYDGTAQALVTGGDANTQYSNAKEGVYSAAVPTETNAGSYTVWYKEKGDANHNDSQPQSIQVTISRKTLTADAANTTLSGSDLITDTDGTYYYQYDGAEKKPSVIIKDGTTAIPAGEYTVSYSDNKNVSTADKKATVTITDSGDGNYNVSGSVTFEIRKGGAQMVTYPQARVLTYTGQQQELITGGTAAGGHVEYKLTSVPAGEPAPNSSFSTDIPEGTNAGAYTVDYKLVGDGNHEDGPTGSISVTIQPKEVISPKITVNGGPFTYTGSTHEPTVTIVDGTTPIPDTEYTLSYRDNVNAGTAAVEVINANGGNYIVNGTATFEITKAAASVAEAPKGLENLAYNGTEQALVTAGTATGGTMVYSLTQDGAYSPAIPTGKAVGEYEIWYKVLGDGNHSDTTPVALSPKVEIAKNTVTNPTIQVTPEKVTYNGEKQEPTVTVKDDSGLLIDGSEYEVTYQDTTNNNTDLIQVGTYTVTVTGVTNGNYTFNIAVGADPVTFTILPADQTPLTITGTRERVYYGDTVQLGTSGGDGTVTWDVGGSTIASIDPNGLLKITGVGSVTVTATSTKPGYTAQTATWPIHVEKKPVTAVVTAASKDYDGITPATTTVTAALKPNDLVSGDVVKITLAGVFEDPNAGTDKRVIVDSTNPQFSADSKGQENYLIDYPTAAAASIRKVNVTSVTPPAPVEDLEYTGLPRELVTEGTVTGGTMEYSLDGKTYSASLPTGTNAGDYDVWYRVRGDGNHNDTAGTKLANQVTIGKQTVANPTIEFNPTGASYDGQEHRPEVTVLDAHGRVIPAAEYTVSYGATNWKDMGDHTITVTGRTDGNYNITGTATKTFTILPAGQSPLSIVGQPGRVQYGDSFTLSATGGSGTGAVTWETSDGTVAFINSQTGRVEVLKSGGPVTITARKAAGGGYAEATATWTFSAEKRPATAIVTARDKEYDTTDTATLIITWKDGDLLNGDTVDLDAVLTGQFNSADAGDGKTVTITGTVPASDKYAVSLNRTTTASITPKAASLSGSTPTTLTYSGQPQDLVTGVAATNGDLAYSTDGSYYTLLVPTGTNAGTYPVWYKAQGSGNYKDSEAVRLNVTIQPKTVSSPTIELSPDSFEYDGTPKKPDVVVKDGSNVIPSGEYTVSYSNNTAVGSNAAVKITNAPGGNYTVSDKTVYFTIKAGVPALVDAPQPKEDLTYTGKPQALVTAGTAVNGKVMYSLDGGEYGTAIPRATDAGDYEVAYKVVDGNGNDATTEDYVYVTIAPKEVTPIIRLENRSSYSVAYNGQPQVPDVTVYVESKLYNDLYYIFDYANNINVGTAEVTVQSVGGNYQFLAFKTFTITKGKAEFSTAPAAKTNLSYKGTAQPLVVPGAAKNGGTVLYSLDNSSYSPLIPTGINRGSYTVYAKVQGSSNYEESDVVIIPVEIGVNTVQNPSVTLPASSFPYTGSEHRPTVTVTDDGGNVIDSSEYTVTYSNNVNAGIATVSIKSNTTSNYSFTASTTFTILPAGQTPLTITGKQDTVYYGDILRLGATGGPGDGAVTWSASGPVDRLGDGQYKVNSSGSVTITATKAASGSYGESSDTWTFYAGPKPVTAVVTATSRPYNDGDTTVTLTVTISGLVSGDIVDTVTAQGHFMDASVGENKIVIITGLNVSGDVRAKYDIGYNTTTTASITPAPATVTAAPTLAAGPLIYNGSAWDLLASGGTAEGGNLMYSLDGQNYSYNLPTATDVGSYTIWYKAVASDENHKDSAPAKVGPVVISANIDTPSVMCTPNQFRYDGTEKTPNVVVRDSAQRIIPESEYTVTLPTPRIAVGTYTVTVTDRAGGNYKFDTPVEGTFQIVSASQNPLSIITSVPADVHYGDTFRLSAMGGSGSGAIHWSIAESGIAAINANGVVTVTGTGGFTVEAYKAASDGYDQSNTASVPFVANPKPVTPVVTAADKPYDGKTDADLTAGWKSGDLVSGDTIPLTVSGKFATPDAGTSKQVDITAKSPDGVYDNYLITWPESTRASIYQVDAKIGTRPVGEADLRYTGSPQPLLAAGGTTVNDVGVVEYSLSEKGEYSTAIPTGTAAGMYTVWYKVADSVNYTGVAPASILVEIKAVTDSGSDSSDDSGSTTDANSIEMRTDVQDGTAKTDVSTADGSRLVQEAKANQSESIVIRPEITGDVTRSEVSIPASTVSQINRETDAALTVSAPIGDVTIPNGALDTLGSAGGTVSVVTEQVDQAVVLTLTAGGETVENIPGGVTLTVPAENIGPGTVAVLVHEDGTRETIRKSVAEDGTVRIPLSGSAKVEIVADNSKDFTDVSSESWAAGAVAFASAHELFRGTSETTFSPNKAMSRGMVTTVLYNLEGRPDQEVTSDFSDVSSGAWYADSVAWAAAKGIADGDENGQFGPNENITREEFVVMLWKYAGSPEAKDKVLHFTDADQVSSGDAREALYWAVENGVLSGYSDGRLAPGGTATRAQAAQMLKNFLENA